MIPGSPFPNDPSFGRHFDEIICVYFTVVLGSRHSAIYLQDDVLRKLRYAKKQNVAVAQPYAVVMVIRMAHFPENTPIPVDFERGAAFPRLTTEKPV